MGGLISVKIFHKKRRKHPEYGVIALIKLMDEWIEIARDQRTIHRDIKKPLPFSPPTVY